MTRVCLFAVAIATLLASTKSVRALEVVVADGNRFKLPIVVPPNADDATKAAAELLAGQLARIVGSKPAIETGDGSRGIAVGRAADFPRLASQVVLDTADPTKREDYLLHSHAAGLWLLGASDLAVRHAVWDLLYRTGYRQYFPGSKWEIVPSLSRVTIDVDSLEHPAYYSRRIWYGFGPWDYARRPYAEWCEKNRCLQGIELNTGHAYDGILARNKAVFAEHPEYLGLVGGERKSTKFCISNPALRQLVIDDALRQFAAEPVKQSVSVDPSDGGGWCECAECRKIGSVTDRALTLANAVATAVESRYPGKFVGMYAYNEHSPPPAIDAHPRVVVSVATAFIHGGYTIDQLLDGWSQRASVLGIREYYSVNTWDRDLPGAARGGRIDYLCQTIPHFHSRGARFLSAESSDNWGPNGLGYFLASRMLWDVDEAEQIELLTDRFLHDCFGEAREPMRRFYALLDGGARQPLCDDLLGRMYRLLDEARQATDDAAVLARLDDLTLYARYCELWLDYSTAQGDARQQAFERVVRHAYRMRETMLIHSLAVFRDVDSRDKSVTMPEEAKFNVPEAQNPWKQNPPLTAEEIASMRKAAIAGRKLLDFTPVSFSDDLVPAAPLKLDASKLTAGRPGTMGLYSRGVRNCYTWVDSPPAALKLTVTAGIIYTNQGDTRLNLFPKAEAEAKSVSQAIAPPSREPTPVDLKTTFAGLHRLEIHAGGGAATSWPEGMPMTIESSFERPGGFHGRWTLYFYVPRGTRSIGGFSEYVGTLRDPDGAVAYTFDAKPGYFNVPVAENHDGKLWKFEHCAGDKMLMTVPPFLARSPAELLLPREVVDRDAGR